MGYQGYFIGILIRAYQFAGQYIRLISPYIYQYRDLLVWVVVQCQYRFRIRISIEFYYQVYIYISIELISRLFLQAYQRSVLLYQFRTLASQSTYSQQLLFLPYRRRKVYSVTSSLQARQVQKRDLIQYYGSRYKLEYNILNRVVIKEGYVYVTIYSQYKDIR